MINFEKYKEDIRTLHKMGHQRIGVHFGKPKECLNTACEECDLYNGGYVVNRPECNKGFILWGLQEYKERPKLTEREHAFCVAANSGYIARDKDEEIFYFIREPVKRESLRAWDNGGEFVKLDVFNLEFSFISWEDAEPWSIEELLKLEVINEKTN